MIPPEPTEGNVTIVQVPACVGLSAPVGEGAVIEDVWLGETLEQACSESEPTMRACFDEFPLEGQSTEDRLVEWAATQRVEGELRLVLPGDLSEADVRGLFGPAAEYRLKGACP